MNKFKIIIVFLLLVVMCYASKKQKKCIKPNSKNKCSDVFDCCEDPKRPISCLNYRCYVDDCFKKTIGCDYDEECCSKHCRLKNGKKVCI